MSPKGLLVGFGVITVALCAVGAPQLADSFNGSVQKGTGQGAGITVRHLNDALIPGFQQGQAGVYGTPGTPTPTPTTPLP